MTDLQVHRSRQGSQVDIIIPCKAIDSYVEKCLAHCNSLNYENFQIILLPDQKIERSLPKTEIISTGSVYPSEKRNIGIKNSFGEFCAFVDSDAYPHEQWLANALTIFADEKVGCVGGPNLIPPDSLLYEQVGTDILYSRLGVGAFPKKKYKKGLYEVRELSSSNLIVRRELLEAIGGFDITLLTAEDAKLCFQINEKDYKVIFAEEVVVYHHRRPIFLPFLESIAIYGRDKAFLLKEFFSFHKLHYFLPSLFLVGLVFGLVLSIKSHLILQVYMAVMFIYFLLILLQSLIFPGVKRKLLIFCGIPLTHIFYGVGFIKGLMGSRERVKNSWLAKKSQV